ncbi:hypothetical protein VF21_09876 [Pseudogymnoascus sp. 05NY08]|nr:hypothetical protein VF21_09876 [Pseudogymnoascus sp. 05NY08]
MRVPSRQTQTASEMSPNPVKVKEVIDAAISQCLQDLKATNKTIHSNPELAWEETIAHDVLCSFLSSRSFQVTASAYDIKTAFEARNKESQPGERCVSFNAEYDALPGIGHACGHNLIATASLTAFVALSAAVEKFGVAGKVKLLGTPAEEAGGGKCALLAAGAYKDVDVSLMGHPGTQIGHGDNNTGTAGQKSIAHLGIFCAFYGKNAHAGVNPWDGLNALDAVVSAYNNICFLRQQMRPEERLHGCIVEAPRVTNVIPAYTKVSYSIRSSTMEGTRKLGDRVKSCFEAAGLATGCRVEISEEPIYADLRINKTLCDRYTAHILEYGEQVYSIKDEVLSGSTDQGNVSYAVPALHSTFGIPGGAINPHNAEFAKCAISDEAFECAIRVGKAMAMTGWEILTDDSVFESCRRDFEADKMLRG